MLCARVMRGISSTENEVTPAAAISCKRLERPQRPQKSDQHLAAFEKGNVCPAGTIVGAVAKNLHDDVGGGEDIAAAGNDLARLCSRTPHRDSRLPLRLPPR